MSGDHGMLHLLQRSMHTHGSLLLAGRRDGLMLGWRRIAPEPHKAFTSPHATAVHGPEALVMGTDRRASTPTRVTTFALRRRPVEVVGALVAGELTLQPLRDGLILTP